MVRVLVRVTSGPRFETKVNEKEESITVRDHVWIGGGVIGDLRQELGEFGVVPELVSSHVLPVVEELDVEERGERRAHGARGRPLLLLNQRRRVSKK